jgi:hypothetical protein
MEMLDRLMGAADLIGVLRHDLAVRLVNISGAGCLLEADGAVKPGTAGMLRVVLDGEELSDEVQVVRCEPVPGNGRSHIGVQWLWTTPPVRRSLRRAVAGVRRPLAATDVHLGGFV